MKLKQQKYDLNQQNQTLFLMSNGNISTTESQNLYEYAWENGVRPLNEEMLKPRKYLIPKGRKAS